MPAPAAQTDPVTGFPDLDSQLDRLLELGYPALAGVDEGSFRAVVEPLRATADAADAGEIPYLLVVTSDWVRPEQALPLVAWRGKPGTVQLTPVKVEQFAPIEAVELPAGPAYLLLDVRTGREYGGRTPESVLSELLAAGRSPLTIDEGVSLVMQQPGVLRERNAFSLLGSRIGGVDRRVPALWTSYGAQRLGWCWDGAVHDWLGAASCAGRVGAA